jgi:hypothetical protein
MKNSRAQHFSNRPITRSDFKASTVIVGTLWIYSASPKKARRVHQHVYIFLYPKEPNMRNKHIAILAKKINNSTVVCRNKHIINISRPKGTTFAARCLTDALATFDFSLLTRLTVFISTLINLTASYYNYKRHCQFTEILERYLK